MLVALLLAGLLLPVALFAGGGAEGAKGPMKELCDGAKIPIPAFPGLQVIVEDPYGKIERELEILETYMTKEIQGVVMYPIDSNGGARTARARPRTSCCWTSPTFPSRSAR